MSEPTASFLARHELWWRRFAYTLGALALLLLAAWLAIPPIVRTQLESRLTAALGRPTTVEAVAFNPFELRLTIRKLAIADRDGPRPLFAFDELVANLSAASVWHRAPVLDALRITRPSVSLSRDRDGRWNAQDLIDSALAPSPGPARFSFNNIELDDGSIAFDDGVTGRKHRVTGLDVGIPFLSSLDYQVDIRVTPRMKAMVNGSQFTLGGSTVPFAEHPEAALDIDLEALPLPSYVAYLPAKLPFTLAGGALTTHLKVVFVDGRPGERRLELRGDAWIDGLALERADGSPLAKAERIALAIDRIALYRNDARIASVALDAPVLDVQRLADGTLEWQQLLAGPPATASEAPGAATPSPAVAPTPAATPTPAAAGTAPRAAPPAPATTPAPPWTVAIARLAITRGNIALADQTSGFQSTLVDVTLDAANLTNKPDEKAHVKIEFVSDDRIAAFSCEADVLPMVPAATGRFALTKFSLGRLFPYYKSALAVDVQRGSIDYASAFALDAAGDLQLTGGESSIADLSLALPGSREPLWRVPQLAIHGIDVDVKGRMVTVSEAQSRGAVLRLVREADGTLEMARLLKTTPGTGTSADEAGWTLLTKKLAVDRVAIDFEDRVPQPPVRLAVRALAATATDLTNARGGKSDVTVRARVGDGGRIAFAGPVAANPLTVEGRLEATGLALVALKPYFEPRVNVILTDGTLAAKGRLSIAIPEGSPLRAAWKGDVTISDFAALDKPTSSDLARWKSLALDGLDMATTPFQVSVDRLGFDDFYARVVVYPDASLNLKRLLTPGASPEPAPGTKPPEPAAAAPREALPVSFGRIEFARGRVNFSDFFVKPNYSSNLTDVAGSISAMSAEQAGDIAITASVEHTAPVEITGRIHPFAKELSLDIVAKASDVDLPPLTPYSSKYAGYGIEKGKLTLDVHYRVENRKLSAENHVVLDQLTFGERVESPDATKLPVLLAVALLKDASGVIDIRLPISGSLDDPQFSIGGLIARVIVNLITRAVTAPFKLLAAAFGGGGEELSMVTFAAGSAAIGDDAQERIDTLGKALAGRPALKLEIGGRADPATDREALRRAAVDAALRREKMKSLVAAGTAPASAAEVTIGADERTRWLTAAYREAPLPERPRNAFGLLKRVPPAEMEAMLYASAKVDDEALRALAGARARAVKDALVARGVAAGRLFTVAPRLGTEAGDVAASGGGAATVPPARVDLALR